MASENLQKLTLEILRLCNPAQQLIPREVLQNCEVNGINLKKGDWLTIPIGANWANQRVYGKDFAEFNIDRHSLKSNQFGLEFMPFSYGKRNCVGRVMGEIMLKLVMGELVRRCEIRNPEGYKRMFTTRGILTVTECVLHMRLR